jgi:ribokinase
MKFAGGVGFTNIDLLYSGLDRIPGKGEEVFAKNFEMQLGGGVPATMINMNRLGVPAKIVTFIGEDFFSGFVRKSFEKYGAELINLYQGSGMPVILSATMVCHHDRSFLSYYDKVEMTPQILESIYQNLKGASVVDMQVGFLEVYQRLHEDGAIQVFDTGWQDDLSIENYKDYLELADYYVPNQKEALKITGESSVEAAAEKLSRFFPDVIIKLDKDGCLLKNKNGITLIPPLEGIVNIDSTGAGDAFLSGFMYGIIHDYPVEESIRFGNVTGGMCVKGMGCLTSYVEEEEMLKLARTIEIKKNI